MIGRDYDAGARTDASGRDAGAGDTGAGDAGDGDAGADAGTIDASREDAAGLLDAGLDAGLPSFLDGSMDASLDAASGDDAGADDDAGLAPDAGTDAGRATPDAGPPPGPAPLCAPRGSPLCAAVLGTGAADVAVDADGTFVVAGRYVGPATFGEPTGTTVTFTEPSGLYVARHRADCTLVWARAAPPLPGGDTGAGRVALGADGSITVAGILAGSVTLGTGASMRTLTATSSRDTLVVRFDRDGNYVWATRAGPPTPMTFGLFTSGLAVAADGSVYITGELETEARFGDGEPGATTLARSGQPHGFIARYGNDGRLLWARTLGTQSPLGGGARGRRVAVTPDGAAIVTGHLTGGVTFGAGEIRAPYYDALFVRYEADGTVGWVRTAGRAAFTVAYGQDVDVADNGAIYVAGYFGFPIGPGTPDPFVTFGPGEPGETRLAHPAENLDDLFVARLRADGSLAWVRTASVPEFQIADSVEATSDGGAYVGGRFAGMLPLGAGLTATGPSTEVFLARYDASGGVLWATQAGDGATGTDIASGIAITASGSLVAGGTFAPPFTISPAAPTSRTLTASTMTAGWLASFAPIRQSEVSCTNGADDDCDGAIDGADDECAPSICSPDGWCWENPLPQGNPVSAVWGSGPEDVWVVGGAETFLHWNGARWSRGRHARARTQGASYYDLWGSARDDVWAVGEQGQIRHYDGIRWSPVPSGTTAAIREVWGTGPTNVYAASDEGILHFDGVAWTRLSTGLAAERDVRVIDGSGPNDIWAGGLDRTLLHFDGTRWTSVATGTPGGIRSVRAFAPNDVWIADGSGEVRHYDGTTWTHTSVLSVTAYTVGGPDAANVWAFGSTGRSYRWDPARRVWDPGLAIRAESADVWASGPADVWVVGVDDTVFSGTASMYHWNGSTWTAHQRGSPFNQHDGWAADVDNAWVVGEEGLILRRDPATASWVDVPSATTVDLRAISASSTGEMWAVGNDVVLRGDATGFRVEGGAPPGPWSDVYAAGPGRAFLVATDGTTARYDGGWTTMTSGATSLSAVYGFGPTDVWAAGSAPKTLIHWDGTMWSPFALPAAGGTSLYALGGPSSMDLWVGGDRDAGAWHWTGSSGWSVVSFGTDARAIFAIRPVDTWVVGGAPGELIHYRGNPPSRPRTGVHVATMRTIFGAPSRVTSRGDSIWIAGDNGAILMHVVPDGELPVPCNCGGGAVCGTGTSGDPWRCCDLARDTCLRNTDWNPCIPTRCMPRPSCCNTGTCGAGTDCFTAEGRCLVFEAALPGVLPDGAVCSDGIECTAAFPAPAAIACTMGTGGTPCDHDSDCGTGVCSGPTNADGAGRGGAIVDGRCCPVGMACNLASGFCAANAGSATVAGSNDVCIAGACVTDDGRMCAP